MDNEQLKMENTHSNRVFCKDILDTLKIELRQEKDKEMRLKLKREWLDWITVYSNLKSQTWIKRPKKAVQLKSKIPTTFFEEMQYHAGNKQMGMI